MRFSWDEAKRLSNLARHGFDFRDAGLVYDSPHKLTSVTERHGEPRISLHLSQDVLAYYRSKGEDWQAANRRGVAAVNGRLSWFTLGFMIYSGLHD